MIHWTKLALEELTPLRGVIEARPIDAAKELEALEKMIETHPRNLKGGVMTAFTRSAIEAVKARALDVESQAAIFTVFSTRTSIQDPPRRDAFIRYWYAAKGIDFVLDTLVRAYELAEKAPWATQNFDPLPWRGLRHALALTGDFDAARERASGIYASTRYDELAVLLASAFFFHVNEQFARCAGSRRPNDIEALLVSFDSVDDFPEHATAGLLPIALGKASKARDAALQIVAKAHPDAVRSVATKMSIDPAVVLDLDPLDILPSKLPKMPTFYSAEALGRPLVGSKAIPIEAVDAVVMCLAISPLGEPYAGIDDLKAACDPESLAELAWDLFQAWLLAGAPPKENWCMFALGHFGNDDIARRLTPLVRAWPGEAAHARAVSALDVLEAIGTDVVLMHLHGIAQKVKFKGLQEKAREKIDRIAEARGLTPDELGDRLVPDRGASVPTGKVLGLEHRGWIRGAPQDGGSIQWFDKQLASGRVRLELEPGISAGAVDVFPEQKLGSVHAKSLGPVELSELVRDLETLRASGAP